MCVRVRPLGRRVGDLWRVGLAILLCGVSVMWQIVFVLVKCHLHAFGFVVLVRRDVASDWVMSSGCGTKGRWMIGR